MQSNQPPPYPPTQHSPQQQQAQLALQPQHPQHTYFPYGPPPVATGVPTWAWVLLGVVVVGFFGLTAIAATALALAKASTDDDAPVASATPLPGEEGEPAAVPTVEGRSALPPVERHVPVHDVTILKGCSTTDIATIERRLDAAIEVGAATYNAGDFEGCYSTYDSAAAKLELALSNSCKGPVTALESGRNAARAKDSPSDRAWAMRDSFDGLFDVIDRAEK